MTNNSNIVLYTAPTPNGHKISITLEELGLKYETKFVNLSLVEHKEPWFLAINPNGRIPALTDILPDGTSISIFESGSIQQYLVDRYDTERKISYAPGTDNFYITNSWLFFQCTGISPMQGQANHFVNYSSAKEPQPYALDRYINESRRLWRTVNKHLSDTGSEFLVGSKCTIADIAAFPWAGSAYFAGIEISEFPLVAQWFQRLGERPAFQRGQEVPFSVDMKKLTKDPKYIEGNREMIRRAMEEERNK